MRTYREPAAADLVLRIRRRSSALDAGSWDGNLTGRVPQPVRVLGRRWVRDSVGAHAFRPHFAGRRPA